MAAPFTREPGPGRPEGGDALIQWAERTGRRSGGVAGRGRLREQAAVIVRCCARA